ncbi:hypothetical protein RvY_07073-2 [Ramazzottius varieornatus]|uniref:Uncharacterized protein n=1 Tax=Ramazzottius varieornatus TaxID=947166 RepID=A0A1D1V138_RAMVA|nr:hypothetical protein RvY_07073-2 [Ramazzottius varieornatus]
MSLSPRSSSGSFREKNRSNYSFGGMQRPLVETNLEYYSKEIMNLTTPEKNPADNETWNNHRSIDTIQEHTGEGPSQHRVTSFRSDVPKESLLERFNASSKDSLRREPQSYGEARSEHDYPSFISSSPTTEQSCNSFSNKPQILSQAPVSDKPLSPFILRLNLVKKIVEVLKFLRDSNLLTVQDDKDKSSLGSNKAESQLNERTTAALEFYLGQHGTLSSAVSREELERPARPSSFTEISAARNALLDPSAETDQSYSTETDDYKRQYLAYLKYLIKYTSFDVNAFDKDPKAWLERLMANRDGQERKEVGDYVNACHLQPAIDAAWDRERRSKLKRTGSYSKFSLAMHKFGQRVLHVGDYRRRCELWQSMSKDIYSRPQQTTTQRAGYAVHPCPALLDVTRGVTAGDGILKKEPVWDLEPWNVHSVIIRTLRAEANAYVLAIQPFFMSKKASKFGNMVDAVELLNSAEFPKDQQSAIVFTAEVQHFAESAYEFWSSGELEEATKREGLNDSVPGEGNRKEHSFVSVHNDKGSIGYQSMGGSKEGSKHDVGAKSDSLKRGTQSLGKAQTLNLKCDGSSKGEGSPGRKDLSLPRHISGLLQEIRQFSFHNATPRSSGKKKSGSASKMAKQSGENLNETFIVSESSPILPIGPKGTPVSTVENLNEIVTVSKTSTIEYFTKNGGEAVTRSTCTTTIDGTPPRLDSSDTTESDRLYVSSVPDEVRMYCSDIAGASSHPASPIASGGTTVYSSVLSQYNRQSVSPGLSGKRKKAEELKKSVDQSPTYLRGVASDQHVPSFIPLSLPQDEVIQENQETHGDQVRSSIGDSVVLSDKQKQNLSSPDQATRVRILDELGYLGTQV